MDKSVLGNKIRITWMLRLIALALFSLFILMSLRTSENASILGRYSPQYLGYLVEILVYSIGFGIFSITKIRSGILKRIDSEISDTRSNLLVVAAVLAMPILYLISELAGINHYIRYSLLLMIPPLIVVWLVYRNGKFDTPFALVRWHVIVILFLALQFFVIIHLFGETPRIIDVDETLETGKAYLIYQNQGKPATFFPGRDAENWLNFPFLFWLSGAYQSLVGVGIFKARALFFGIGVASLPFIYGTAKRLYGTIAGWSAVLLAFSMLLHYNWARPDIWVVTATAISTYCFCVARADQTKQGLLSSLACGFFIVASIEGHFYGILFTIVFCFLHLYEQLAHMRKYGWKIQTAFIGFVLGSSIAALLWFWYHIALPGIQLSDIYRLFNLTYTWESTHITGQEGFERVFYNIYKLFRHFYVQNNFELFLSIIVVSGAILRRKKPDQFLLVVGGGSFLLLLLLMAHARASYFVFWMPLIAILFGALVQDLSKKRITDLDIPQFQLTNIAMLFLSFILVLYVIEAFRDASNSETIRNKNHLEVLVEAGQRLDEVLPEEDIKIIGNIPFYLGMPQRLNFQTRFWGEPILLEELKVDLPEALILVLGEPTQKADVARYIEMNDFSAVDCIPIPQMDSYFGKVMGENRIISLFVHPRYDLVEHSENCTPEMLAWLDA